MYTVTRSCPNGVIAAHPQMIQNLSAFKAVLQAFNWIRVGYAIQIFNSSLLKPKEPEPERVRKTWDDVKDIDKEAFVSRENWTDWESNKAPPGTTHGTDMTAMLHGGSIVRGNIYSCIDWGSVVAVIVHGHVYSTTLEYRARLKWAFKPRR